LSVLNTILISLAVCLTAGALEALFAGSSVKPFLGRLKTPSLSPSLSVWSLIGVGYYAICFVLLYRLFRHNDGSNLREISLALLLIVMLLNAFWNYTFFRMQDLRVSFTLSLIYGAFALALLACLTALDHGSAIVFLPYILYMIYSYRWGYALLKLNPDL